MTIIVNIGIAMFIVAAMMGGALHYYPGYQPANAGGWILLVIFITLVVVVGEAIADGAGILKSWPKTQRFIAVAIIITAGCTAGCIAGLPYIERLR